MRAAAALLLSIRVDAAVHFVVLSDINSGSTFFQQVLDSHPKVEMQREPLRKIELPAEKTADASASTASTCAPHGHLCGDFAHENAHA